MEPSQAPRLPDEQSAVPEAEAAQVATPEVEAERASMMEPEAERTAPPPRRLTRATALRIAFLALALALGVYAVARQWAQVRADLAEIGLPILGAALAVTLVAWFAMMATWRGLLADFGSRLPWHAASRIFFLGQLGKYIPGSVWPVLAQMELGRAHDVPRRRSAAVAILAMLVSLASALVVAASTLPWAAGPSASAAADTPAGAAATSATAGYAWAFLAVPVVLAGLHPRVANPVIAWLFRVTRRPPLEHALTGRAIAAALARNLTAWVLAGLHVWFLAVRLGAPTGRTFLLAVGGFAFAWSVGFLVVLAPAGAGIRELILIAALSPVLSTSQATAVALASRLVTIVADLVSAAVAGALKTRAGAVAGSADPGSAVDDSPLP